MSIHVRSSDPSNERDRMRRQDDDGAGEGAQSLLLVTELGNVLLRALDEGWCLETPHEIERLSAQQALAIVAAVRHTATELPQALGGRADPQAHRLAWNSDRRPRGTPARTHPQTCGRATRTRANDPAPARRDRCCHCRGHLVGRSATTTDVRSVPAERQLKSGSSLCSPPHSPDGGRPILQLRLWIAVVVRRECVSPRAANASVTPAGHECQRHRARARQLHLRQYDDPGMDTQTIDQEFEKLKTEFHDVAATVTSLAEKMQVAKTAGDANATEWLNDLKQIAKDIDDEQLQAHTLLHAIHGFIANSAQAQTPSQPEEKPPLFAPARSMTQSSRPSNRSATDSSEEAWAAASWAAV